MSWFKFKIGNVLHSEYSFCQLPWQPGQFNWFFKIPNFDEQNYFWTDFTIFFESI